MVRYKPGLITGVITALTAAFYSKLEKRGCAAWQLGRGQDWLSLRLLKIIVFKVLLKAVMLLQVTRYRPPG